MLGSFNATCENQKADVVLLQPFQCTDIKIKVPSGSKLVAPQILSIPGLYYQNIIGLIKETFESPVSLKFHLTPFKLFCWRPNHDECIYSEMYNSDIFLEEHDKVQCALTKSPCKREKVVAALMFWSDTTHLATFGTAKLWPIYMLFGNLSKYIRCKPSSGAIKHLAYIPPFPDLLHDELKAFHEKWESQKKDVLTHCCCKLMHEVWKILLDPDFLHAYKDGMVVQCYDGIEQRIYLRIFTYSADYPEK
jgi:Plavaka transposase